MKCPFRKIISKTKELKEDGLIVDEATTEVFAECLKYDCMAYRAGIRFDCGLIEHVIKNT